MKVTLAMVTSLDGKSTKGDTSGTSPWASPEDQTVFQGLIAAHDCVVMGSTTYKSIRHFLRPSRDKPRIILTRTPHQFAEDASTPGLVFTSESPTELTKRLTNEGCEKMLLVGGAQTNAQFLDAGMVDEIFVTIEPTLFGAGQPFVTHLERAPQLELVSHELLNTRGTLLLHYLVKTPKEGK